MPSDELLYQIGLTLINGIGHGHAKNLLTHCGSAKSVFETSKSDFLKIPGIGEHVANSIINGKDVLKEAEKEVRFVEENNITPLFYTDENYPQRLKFCHDSPILLYYRGNANLNVEKVVAVVGTRLPSEYGIEQTKKFIDELKNKTNTVHSNLKTFRKIFNDAIREDLIEPNQSPFTRFKLSLEKTTKA